MWDFLRQWLKTVSLLLVNLKRLDKDKENIQHLEEVKNYSEDKENNVN